MNAKAQFSHLTIVKVSSLPVLSVQSRNFENVEWLQIGQFVCVFIEYVSRGTFGLSSKMNEQNGHVRWRYAAYS